MKNFAMTGVAGYIAPRHLQAIKETGNRLVAAVDPHDSVGILDQYFPDTSFFTEFERFDRHIEKLRRSNRPEKIDYLTICSPSNLHDAHIRFALRIGADAICEKPLVLNPWNLDALEELENESGKKVYTILQLRVHPEVVKMKQRIEKELSQNPKRKYTVTLHYITSRGLWYNYSWKGDSHKSGGIATNIGIHFFDLLIFLFGNVKEVSVRMVEPDRMKGTIEFSQAEVGWFLSIKQNDLPGAIYEGGLKTYRSIKIDGEEIELTDGFTDLHTNAYQGIFAGNGFGIAEARPSIELVYQMRKKIK